MRYYQYIVCLLVLTLAMPMAIAEDAPTAADTVHIIPKPLAVMPAKIKPLQEAGKEISSASPEIVHSESSEPSDSAKLESMSPSPNKGFPSTLWQDATRDELVAFLSDKAISKTISPTIRGLNIRAVMTATPAYDIPDGKESLYALKIQKLLALGAIEEAQSFAVMGKDATLSPLAIQMGLESSLMQGKTAVACLDEKTTNESVKSAEPTFWGSLALFCDSLLSPVAGDDDTMRLTNASRIYLEAAKIKPLDLRSFETSPLPTSIAMVASGKYRAESDTAEMTDKALAIALNYAKLSPETLTIWREAHKRGMVTSEKMEELAKSAEDSALQKDLATLTEKESINPEINESYFDSLIKMTESEVNDANNHKKAILLALKSQSFPQNLNNSVYDNILSLTASDNYVMHNTDELSSLKESAEKKRIDQVLVKSLAMIGDTPLEKLHPVALYRILEAFNSVGLNEETIRLTREVLGTMRKIN